MKKITFFVCVASVAITARAGDAGTYQRLSFIGGDGIDEQGRQWVNSGYTPKCTDRIEAKVRMRSLNSAQGLYCTRYSQTSKVFACIMPSAHLGYWRFDRNGDNANGLSSLKMNTTDVYEIVADYNTLKCTINGVEVAEMASGEFACDGPLYISTVYNTTAPSVTQNWGKFDLYYFRIYDKDGTLVREYLPAWDKADETVARYGLFETVTGTFCPNENTQGNPFHIGEKDLDRTFDVADIEPQIFSRTAVEPKVEVADGSGSALTEGTHYTVGYLRNDSVGTATAVVSGIPGSDYEDVTVYKQFALCHARLPEGYRRVEYIESTKSGLQWVNTEYVPRGTDRVEFKVRFSNASNGDGLYCSRLNSTEDFFLCVAPSADASHLRFDRNADRTASSSLARTAGVDYVIAADGKTLDCTMNGTKVATMGAGPFLPAGPFALFALYMGGTLDETTEVYNYGLFRLYWFRVYDEAGQLVREYVPAEDERAEEGSSRRYGLFETVRGTFHGNNGASAFVAGTREPVPSVAATFDVEGIPAQVLKGSRICEPEVEVSDSRTGAALVKGRDYTVRYLDNSGSGTATAIVMGMTGTSYEGWSVIRPFTVSYRKLREPYQRVRYIASTAEGDQWIDTGYVPTCTDRIEIGFVLGLDARSQGLYCTRTAANANTFSAIMPSANLRHFRFDRNTDNVSAVSEHEFHVGTRYDLTVDGDSLECSVNGVMTATMSGGTFTIEKPFALFAIYQQNTDVMMNFARMRIYYFRVWDKDGKLKCECVPARDTTVEEGGLLQCGMYDTVTGTFHPNKGVAAFEHGVDEPFVPGPQTGMVIFFR